ncbi:3-oxoacyl-[acyl-carrier-protein] synthase III C-terminal domain-containing protein [Micromonospora olivasterospora]|nr:3-oxoacyl-[acyl-carrier-protein] synthase III C-terminal domain-containing protein [Micromonospora olivasterospora]
MDVPLDGAPHAAIVGIGGYLPERVVTNREVCAGIDSTEEWIQRRSGIRLRRFAGPEETLAVMGHADLGNAAAASVPMALDRLVSRAPEVRGGLALLLGFGAGLLYAGQVVRLP